jgi:TonB family protein
MSGRMSDRQSGGGVLRRIAIFSLVAHGAFGFGFTTMDLSTILPPGVWGMEDKEPVLVTLTDQLPEAVTEVRAVMPLPPIPDRGQGGTERNVRPDDPPQGQKSGGGGGDPLARVTKMGVLGKLDGSPGGQRVSSVEGGVVHAADGIAQLLRGVGATRKAASGPPAQGEPGIGFGSGIGSGFGGGVATQKAEDLVASFGDGSGKEIILEKHGTLEDGTELPFIETGGCREETEIARIVRGHRGGVRGCYNRSLLRNPDQSGEVSVRFVISPDGRVTSAKILTRTFHDAEMESCLLERIRAWVFPEQVGCETVVRYSFHFSSGP